MPWQERTFMSLKCEFIVLHEAQARSFSALCLKFGISRKTGYKWLRRYESEGRNGLIDKRTLRSERKKVFTPESWERVFAFRRENPTWGARKITKALALLEPERIWPSASLTKRQFRLLGLSHPREVRSPIVSERLPLRKVNDINEIWGIDFKGWFTTKEKKRCEPLTLQDLHSRYLLRCEPMASTTSLSVIQLLEKAFHEYGMPKAIRSDNGSPFGSHGFRGLNPLSIWLLKQGIWPEKIYPGKPQQNGRLERLHRTLKEDVLMGPRKTYAEYQNLLAEFTWKYNNIRPHEALGDLPPCKVYKKSLREYRPDTPLEYEYPAGYQLLHVNSNGYVSYKGQRIYLSESLQQENIGIGKEEPNGHPILFLGYPLGYLEQHQNRTKNKKVLPL